MDVEALSRKKILWIEVAVVLLLAFGPWIGESLYRLASPYSVPPDSRILTYFSPQNIGSSAYAFAISAFVMYTLWASDGASLDFRIRMRPDGWIVLGVLVAIGLAVLGAPPTPEASSTATAFLHDMMVRDSVFAAICVVGQVLLLVTMVGYLITRLSELLPGRVLPLVGMALCALPLGGISLVGMLTAIVLAVLFGMFYQKTQRLGMLFAISVLFGMYGLMTSLAKWRIENG